MEKVDMESEKRLKKPDIQNAFASPVIDERPSTFNERPSTFNERPSTFTDTLKDMAESSSLHGITKIVSSRQIVVKILWSLLVLTAFSVFSIQLYYLFKTYYSYPSQTSVTLDFDSIDFPAITLCNINPVRKSKLDNSDELKDIAQSVKSDYYVKKRRRRRKREATTEHDTHNDNNRETRSINIEGDNNMNHFKISDTSSLINENIKPPNFNELSRGSSLQDQGDVQVDLGKTNEAKLPNTYQDMNDKEFGQVNVNDVNYKQKVLDLQHEHFKHNLDDAVDKRYKRDTGDSEVVQSSSMPNSDTSNLIQSMISPMPAMPVSTLFTMTDEMTSLVMTSSTDVNLLSSFPYDDMFVSQDSYSNLLFSSEDLFDYLSMEMSLVSNYELNSDLIDNSVNPYNGPGGNDGSSGGRDKGSGGGDGGSSGGGDNDSGGEGSSWAYSGSYDSSAYDEGSWSDYSYYSGYNYYYDQLNAVKDEWDEKIENFKEIIKNETIELRREIGHQKEDMIISATFAGRVQNVSHFKDFMSVEYGNCYTIESPKYVAWRSGPTHALKLTLNVEIDEYVDNLSTGYGIRIVFHEPGTYPLPSHEGITLSPGTETNIGLRRVQITRLGKPHGDCIDGMEFKNLYDRKYSISACYEFCRILKAIQECDCIPAESPDEVHLNSTALPVCNTTDDSETFSDGLTQSGDFNFEMNVNTRVEKCLLSVDVIFDSGDVDCSCNGPCQEIVYTKTLSSTFWPTDEYLTLMISDICETKNSSDFWYYPCSSLEYLKSYTLSTYRYNFLRVLIYYEDLNYESIDEEPMYESVRFLSDIGGAMGLFLGASVLSFVEFVQLILEIFLYFKHKNERQTRVRNFITSVK